MDEIPENELSTILEKRCKVPESYAKKMVDVMKELQLLRQRSKVFAGKHGFITPRDLFRWADRFRTFGSSYEDLARDGYYLLAERLRDEDEKCVVQEVLERHLRVKLAKDDLYKQVWYVLAVAVQVLRDVDDNLIYLFSVVPCVCVYCYCIMYRHTGLHLHVFICMCFLQKRKRKTKMGLCTLNSFAWWDRASSYFPLYPIIKK